MLRITELKLPLDHDDDALPAAIVARLGIAAGELSGYSVARRSYDARKRGAIMLIYSVDVDTPREAELLARLQQEPGTRGQQGAADAGHHVQIRRESAAAPAAAPAGDRHGPVRPVRRAGAGADGLPADHPRARQGGARAHGRHLRAVAQEGAGSGIQRAVRRRRRRHVLRRQAVQPDQRQAAPRAQGAGGVRRRRCAGGNPLRQQAAHRHLPAGVDGGAHARDDRIAGRRDPLRQPRRRHPGRNRCGRRPPPARGHPGQRRSSCAPTTWCWRSATARATPSPCCTRAACSSKPSRSRSASASSIRNR